MSGHNAGLKAANRKPPLERLRSAGLLGMSGFLGGSILNVLQRDFACSVDAHIDYMPPAVGDFAIMCHVKVHSIFSGAIQSDLQARRRQSSR